MKVLIAEDEPTSRRLLQSLLARWGYEAVTACDGAEAWEILRGSQPPPLAVLDWMMPEVDGVELCRRVRASQPELPLYLIMLTALTRKQDIVTALEAGADDYLTKPFTAEELKARMAVGERTLALQQALRERVRDLERAQEQIVRQERLRGVGEVASGVAHDFNNLLSTVLGRAELLLLRCEEATWRRDLEIIKRAAADGKETVARIQRFAGRHEEAGYVPVSLGELVEDALALTQHRWKSEAERLGITITARAELDASLSVLGSPAELREVLVNLIVNACDAMPQGGELVLNGGQEGSWGVLRVRDTGTGMDAVTCAQVFDLFFSTKGAEGTGLGLSISRGIVQRHGGHLELESAPGRGTTCALFLPLAEEPLAATGEQSPGVAAPAAALRLLLVDDDPLVLDTLEEALDLLGYTVTAVPDGAQAVEALRRGSFDLVLTDLGMPGMSGWQVAEEAKRLVPGLPVVVLTGWGETVEQSPHVDLTLAKPVDLETLQRALGQTTQRLAA